MDLHAVVTEFIQRELIKDEDITVAGDDPLITGGLIESFDLVKLALFIEQRCGVRIEDSNLTSETMNTVNSIVSLIEGKRR